MSYITRENLKILMKAISAMFSPMSNEDAAEELLRNDMLPVVTDYDGSVFTDGDDIIIW